MEKAERQSLNQYGRALILLHQSAQSTVVVLLLWINEDISLCLSILVSHTLVQFRHTRSCCQHLGLLYRFGRLLHRANRRQADSTLDWQIVRKVVRGSRGQRSVEAKAQGCTCQRMSGRMCTVRVRAHFLAKIKETSSRSLFEHWMIW